MSATDDDRVIKEASVVDVFNVLLQQRRLLMFLPAAAFVLIVGVTLVLPRSYTASTSFMLQAAQGAPSRLAGIASQLGFGVPAAESGTTPAFYEDLLRSRTTIRRVISSEYAFAIGEQEMAGNLMELYDIKAESEALRREAAIKRLLGKIAVSTGVETGIVRLSVTTRWAPLAEQIASRMLEVVSDFDLEVRQSQAGAERKFIQERLADVRGELRAAENALEGFLRENRDFDAPELIFERDRLRREVLMRQEIYTSLGQSYEQARIDEVRNTPVITIIEQPEIPPLPDRRRLRLKGLAAIFLGLTIAVIVAFMRAALASDRERDPESYERARELLHALGSELRNPFRLLTKR